MIVIPCINMQYEEGSIDKCELLLYSSKPDYLRKLTPPAFYVAGY